ncbi:HlyD family efflux transporter periplasmic adaptor subunit [Hymenobacter monticola]|uniref:HlyD family efflux transporter periplasmic adaptor subunit n=1 Tax=Hymenobacter monticola TaxID=1705399 RepID=A0ABY4BC06_9BACT|nr:HlyD family efflux transporter periplasmic adaptor subunit [Hymenobacter monticola]UOE36429.1 HlyD family efflux transporter periplasmic adaptor subunit [Hymenobacter monticola]
MNQSTTFVELRSEEVQELLARPPRWLLRWGITVVFLILLSVFAGAWVIHYPDLVRASFKLTTANAPKAVLARTDGKIVRLFVQEGQLVPPGATLAYLESTARHDEVIHLARELKAAWAVCRRGNLEGLRQINLSAYHQLGELQNDYQTFEQRHIQLRAYLADGFYSKKRKLLQLELIDLQTLAQQQRQQRVLQARDATLAQEDYETQRQLAEQKVIPELEFKREESKNIARQLAYQQTASVLVNNVTAQRAKQKEILELDKQVAEERDQFLQALNTLQSAVNSWQARYVLSAPVSGRVFFPGIIQENQVVATSQELFYVAPPSATYIGELRVPQQNAGKVQVGQDVLVKFAGFPYQEYGAIRGQITAIANISFKDSIFLARVALPAGLKTTYGKSLAYRTGMTASADIITADNRLLEKLFYQLRKVTEGQ